jgi:pullulanase
MPAPSASMARGAVALLLAASSLACGNSGGSQPDSGSPDAGTPDSGTPDAGTSGLILHYHRPGADYSGWQAVAASSTIAAASTDGFGAVYNLTASAGATVTFSLASGTSTDAAGTLSVDTSKATEAWVLSGWKEAITRRLPALPDATHAVVYYGRADATYTGWGLHLWGDQVTATDWASPLAPAGIDPEFGAGFLIPITGGSTGNCTPGWLCVIAHNGGNKDPGPDMTFDPKALGNLVFLTSGSSIFSTTFHRPTIGNAHLLSGDTLAWRLPDSTATVELRYSANASLTITDADVTGGQVIATTYNPAGLSTAQKGLTPQLSAYNAYSIAAADLPKVKDALKGQLVAVERNASGQMINQAPVQTSWALDALYGYDGPLGITFAADHTPTFTLWAPTARTLTLHVFDASKAEVAGSPFPMVASASGAWSYTGLAAWYGGYYRYELNVYHPDTKKVEDLTVTDPYAVNLSTNGLYAQIIDLGDAATKPANWDTLQKPALVSDWAPTDMVIYESHLRDFSYTDPTTPAERRGKYLGFVTDQGAAQSDGLKHLQALAQAGLTHVHLLPVFDIASVDEDPANQVNQDQTFAALCAKNTKVAAADCTRFGTQVMLDIYKGAARDSLDQQTVAYYDKGYDGYNWGYDPFHYGAPEGSYASTADGSAKVKEFRTMVQGLSAIGLRVIMDVVYNHTNAGGVGTFSVLDKVVPGYYHRRDPDTGAVYNSSCCANTATERHMMERLMTDTLVRWARDYKVDGFRFDLMGLQPKAAMLRAQARLAALTVAADGVDGSKIYLYGEGWEMGEVSGNALFVNANQPNMGGSGIGTFNDRIRDAVRGGGPFDSGITIRTNQGFASGLFVDPNEQNTSSAASDKATALRKVDWIKLGMAANLTSFVLVTGSGATSTGAGLDYNGSPAGYAKVPADDINYVSAHDNQVLFDILQAKLPTGLNMTERTRYQNLALDTVLLAQGVPFIHMGDDLLRSKSEDGNSYDSGDWFNRIDWSGQTSAWASGLPMSGDNSTNYLLISQLFKDASIAPAAAHIAAARAHLREMLAIRKSTRLLRLATTADVLKRVDFANTGPGQIPGVIALTVTDGTCTGADLDPARDGIVAILNATPQQQVIAVPGAAGFTLHTVQQASADAAVKTASFSGGSFTVPARTTAVFEALQTGGPGSGLPCNTH